MSKSDSVKTLALVRGDGEPDIIVTIRRHAAARHLSLRYYPVPRSRGASGFVLTLPPLVPVFMAKSFLTKQRDWMVRQINTSVQAQAQSTPNHGFIHGAIVPILGIDHEIVTNAILPSADLSPTARITSKIAIEKGKILVATSDHLAGDLITVTLKNRARQELQQRSDAMFARLREIRPDAARLGDRLSPIRLSDATSRWGSCSSNRVLRYHWRLIFAPPNLVEYIVAHEVAHLVEMNHSPKFWAVVHQLVGDHRPHRLWLKQNGRRLFSYGNADSA